MLIPLYLRDGCVIWMGVDDSGKAFDLSPDPAVYNCLAHMLQTQLEEGQDVESAVISSTKKMKQIFGIYMKQTCRTCMWILERNDKSNGSCSRNTQKIRVGGSSESIYGSGFLLETGIKKMLCIMIMQRRCRF